MKDLQVIRHCFVHLRLIRRCILLQGVAFVHLRPTRRVDPLQGIALGIPKMCFAEGNATELMVNTSYALCEL